LEAEQLFWQRSPIYGPISNRLGAYYLATRLNQLLIAHIKDRIPQLKKSVNEMLHQKESELVGYGQPIS
jgi:dynamin 1-like protein